MVLAIIYMTCMGLFRIFLQVLIVNFDFSVFLTPPFLPLVPFSLSVAYVIAGLLTIRFWRLGSVLSIMAIVAHVLAESYGAVLSYGYSDPAVTYMIIVLSLDIAVLIYVVRALMTKT